MYNFIIQLLGIEDNNITIDDYFKDKDGKLIIYISYKKVNQVCPECGSVSCYSHDFRPRRIIHSRFTNQPCDIIYNRRRYKCKDCNKIFNETNYISSGNNRISDITLNAILKDLKTTDSYTNIAKRYNLTTQTVLNYMDRYIDPQRRELPEVLCIDEFKNLSFGKGKYACLLMDYQTGNVIDVLPNRRLDYLQYYFNHISVDERNKVKFVVSDMYDGYKHLAQLTFPKATLVIDAFHYIRYVSEAFNQVRRRIQEQFPKKSREYKLLKNYWRLLSKDSNKLKNRFGRWSNFKNECDTYEVIQEIKNIHPDIKTAYLMKEDFFSSYRKINYEQAYAFVTTLINSFENTNLPEFIELAKMFKNWKEYIVNSFNKDEYGRRMSNGIIEGSNNKIKVIKRVSYGYSNFYHLRNRIFYIFNEDEEPRPIPKSKDKIDQDKFPYVKKRK